LSLGCARCGACCDPVALDFSVWQWAVTDARTHASEDFASAEHRADRMFIAASLRPVSAEGGVIYLACRFYDREHMACRAYEDRPPMCSGYPWYGRDPEPYRGYGQCSYQLDLPPSQRPEGSRPLIPLTVVSRPSAWRAACGRSLGDSTR